ncbi:MAG: FadR/GntR family transcriptional regulator [Eubacteriales bacterium]|nr:FadR/GntR family transcriptional regulator [Eubacteriales bacterium]MDY4898892.1 FadR/GntR family transcriptional regulator [Eubacteriales bacterium]
MQNNFNTEIKRVTMYEQIADRLEEMILSDHISATDKLPSEQALATSFGVSRPVIREALMLLNARGLISQKNGEGAYISQPTTEDFNRTVGRMVRMSDIDMSSLFEVRLVLEVLSAQLAANNAIPEDIQELNQLVDEMSGEKEDKEKFARDDTRFHSRIAMIGGNRMLYLFLNSLTEQIATMIEHNLMLDGANEDAERYHRKLIEAIASGSPESAADVMRSHIIMSMRNAELTRKRVKDKKH